MSHCPTILPGISPWLCASGACNTQPPQPGVSSVAFSAPWKLGPPRLGSLSGVFRALETRPAAAGITLF